MDREHVPGRLDVGEERPAVARERRAGELRLPGHVVAGEEEDVGTAAECLCGEQWKVRSKLVRANEEATAEAVGETDTR